MNDLKERLLEYGVPAQILDIVKSGVIDFQGGLDFFEDKWDVQPWMNRPGNARFLFLDFSRFENLSIKVIAKSFIAIRRLQTKMSAGSAYSYVRAFVAIESVLGGKEPSSLVTEDFFEIEAECAARSESLARTMSSCLHVVGGWFRTNFGFRLDYSTRMKKHPLYGRRGTEEGRKAKFLPLEIVRDLFSLAGRVDLEFRDKFYISALVINAALGVRINELSCLPKDCLVNLEGKWVFKIYPEKGSKITIRPFPQDLYPAVKEAVDFIKRHTEQGRRIAQDRRSGNSIDWTRVKHSEQALEYFARKCCAKWRESCSVFTPKGVWHITTKQFVNPEELALRLGSTIEAAKYLDVAHDNFNLLFQRQVDMGHGIYSLPHSSKKLSPLIAETTNWLRRLRRSTPNAISVDVMKAYYQVPFQVVKGSVLGAVLDDELRRQFEQVPSGFAYDHEFEHQFCRKYSPLVRRVGHDILRPEDALFVIPQGLLNPRHKVVREEYSCVSGSMFKSWLYSASRGEGSLFSRYGIFDPRTGNIARLVWHDIRHWLNTVYKQGGLTDMQVNTILGRSEFRQAECYDHTPALDRARAVEAVMAKVKGGKAVGAVADTYQAIKLESRQEAEEYLLAALRVINPMPHGGCTMNLALKPCPHNLSCLSQGGRGEPCNHLVIDIDDANQIEELKRIEKNAFALCENIREAGGENGPQFRHLESVSNSVKSILIKVVGVA